MIKVLDILADVAVFILAIVMITVGFSYATALVRKVIMSACRGCPILDVFPDSACRSCDGRF